jgi:hypothetical protein
MQIETDSYNERRYGKPWIAIITFENPTKPHFDFGTWVGEQGDSGILEIDLKEGDVVARGQKDFRKPANSALNFYIVKNGELVEATKKDAYLHFKAGQPSDEKESLLKRRAKLLNELDEINRKLTD